MALKVGQQVEAIKGNNAFREFFPCTITKVTGRPNVNLAHPFAEHSILLHNGLRFLTFGKFFKKIFFYDVVYEGGEDEKLVPEKRVRAV